MRYRCCIDSKVAHALRQAATSFAVPRAMPELVIQPSLTKSAKGLAESMVHQALCVIEAGQARELSVVSGAAVVPSIVHSWHSTGQAVLTSVVRALSLIISPMLDEGHAEDVNAEQ